MKPFLSEDFLLSSDYAKRLYHGYAEQMPIIDYHCHIDPRAIYEDHHYKNITEVWLGGDHYKWRAMRCAGIPERNITGGLQEDPYRVFEAWADTLPRAIGNPLYHWTYLELKRYFGVTEPLNAKSCRAIYEHCNEVLARPDMGVRGIIDRSRVQLICTTDDPADHLEWHEKLADDPTCRVKVLPAFRPDKAMSVDKPGFGAYLQKLAAAVGYPIDSFAALCRALAQRIDYFAAHGCRASDHGLTYCVYEEATEAELEAIFARALEGPVCRLDGERFQTAILLFLAAEYAKHGWVMQLHVSCIRNSSSRMFEKIGPDTGYDAIATGNSAEKLAAFLDAMERRGALPKTVLYSLNQYDNEAFASLAGCFQTDSDVPSRVQLGAAWWFNDHYLGMRKQLTDVAILGVLGSFIGMLTDSRSFLSYTRHEYFRRILCDLIGGWAENGEIHDDIEALGGIVRDISFNNTNRYFGFGLEAQNGTVKL